MKVKMIITGIAILIGLLVVSAWVIKNRQPDPATATPTISIANPASANCVQKGGKLEIRTAAGGDQFGVCTFPDGSECEEWALLRGECTAGPDTPSQWRSNDLKSAKPSTGLTSKLVLWLSLASQERYG